MVERRHYSTYYFANIVCNVLRDPRPYLRNLEGFWGSEFTEKFFAPFPKWSALHEFSRFIITDLLFEEDTKSIVANEAPEILWVESAAQFYNITDINFANWLEEYRGRSSAFSEDDVYDFYCDLQFASEQYEKLLSIMVRDTFDVLFAHRSLLMDLNVGISYGIGLEEDRNTHPEFGHLFNSKGALRRAHIPTWASRAVFYRDKGRCVLCEKDLTGLLSPDFAKHMDHIVPLANGGINDVTNLQLLCGDCNLKKSDSSPNTRDTAQHWYKGL